MAVGCVNQANAAPREKTRCSSPINSTVYVGRFAMLDIAMLDVTSTSRLTQREWPPWCSKLCRWDFVFPVKTEWPVGDVVLYTVEQKLCIGVVMAIVMALRSLIKTESRTAKLRQVDSHCQGLTGKSTSDWMNQSFLLCSLPVCPFLILSFQVVCFLRKNPSARLGMLSFHSMLPLKFQGTWMVPSSYPFLRKQTSERKTQNRIYILYMFLKCFCISLPINAKKNLLEHLFLRSIRFPFGAPFEAQQWKFLSSVSIFVAFLY